MNGFSFRYSESKSHFFDQSTQFFPSVPALTYGHCVHSVFDHHCQTINVSSLFSRCPPRSQIRYHPPSACLGFPPRSWRNGVDSKVSTKLVYGKLAGSLQSSACFKTPCSRVLRGSTKVRSLLFGSRSRLLLASCFGLFGEKKIADKNFSCSLSQKLFLATAVAIVRKALETVLISLYVCMLRVIC